MASKHVLSQQRRKGESIKNLVGCILNYKIKCYFTNIGFDADKCTI